MVVLSERENTVVKLRYGKVLKNVGDCEIPECDDISVHGHTYEEIGKFLGVTKERVRHIEKEGLKNLGKTLELPAIVPSSDASNLRGAKKMGWLLRHRLAEIREIEEAGLDVAIEMDKRDKQAFKNYLQMCKDKDANSEKYWVTGKGGSITTRSAPVVPFPYEHPQILPNGLNENDKHWRGDYFDYVFYVVLHKDDTKPDDYTGYVPLLMEVKMLPEQYIDTLVKVYVPFLDFEVEVRTSEIGKVSEADQKIEVNTDMFEYDIVHDILRKQAQEDNKELYVPSPSKNNDLIYRRSNIFSSKNEMQIRLNDTDLFGHEVEILVCPSHAKKYDEETTAKMQSELWSKYPPKRIKGVK